MVCLARQISSRMVIDAILYESGIAQIGPQNGDHAELMGQGKGLGNFPDLPAALFRAIIDGCADGGRPHVKSLLHPGEEKFIVFSRIHKQVIMVDLEDEGYPVGVFPGDGPENAQG